VPWLLWCLLPLALGVLGYWRLGSAHYREDVAQRNGAIQRLFSDYSQFAGNLGLVRQFPSAGIHRRVQEAVQQFDQRFSHWVSRAGHLAALIQVLLSAPWLLAWVVLGTLFIGVSEVGAVQVCGFLLLVRAMAAPVLALGHGFDALNNARASARAPTGGVEYTAVDRARRAAIASGRQRGDARCELLPG